MKKCEDFVLAAQIHANYALNIRKTFENEIINSF